MISSAAIILIGTELTRGIIQDRHGQFITKALTGLGIHTSQVVEIPDDGSIESILSAIVKKNDLVIITGGLGPTSDDMTRECIADVSQVPLVRNEESYRDLYERIGEKIHGANEKQTLIPSGFTRIRNGNGTADGFYGSTPSGCIIISLPGPPGEMQPMFEQTVLPYLSSLSGHAEETRREYSSFITAEAKLEDLTQQIAPSLNWATRFQDWKISLYLSGGSEEEKDRAIETLRSLCGPELIIDGDTSALDELIALLRKESLTISCAESCTGGLASSLLTERAGSSDFFPGSVVSYSNEMKQNVLSVKAATLMSEGAVSRECAIQMAEGVRNLTGSDYAFSITGVAGPAQSERKPVGTVCFGFCGKDRKSEAVTLHFSSWGRASVRRKSVCAALILARCFIQTCPLDEVVSRWSFI